MMIYHLEKVHPNKLHIFSFFHIFITFTHILSNSESKENNYIIINQ